MGEKKQPKDTKGAAEIDEAKLDEVAGGAAGRTYTGGRFQLDIGGHNVGFLQPSPPPPPATKP